MCGIAGAISKNKVESFLITEIEEACRQQVHRGPDDRGTAVADLESGRIITNYTSDRVEGKVALGFVRLSIQDLSENGHQPMVSDDGKVVLVYNGEIYNFKILRAELENIGYKFKSNTDTEVILKLYLEYGITRTLELINGMFSLAIVDLRNRKMYIARDRFGIKPLYIARTSNSFIFASEIKSILAFKDFKPFLDEHAVQEFMLFKSCMKRTLLKDVEQVIPGTMIEYDLDSNDIRDNRYFDVENYHRNKEGNFEDLKERTWETLKSVVGRQVISDVTVGCQLSGGIDSSIITKIVSEEHRLYDTVSCKVSTDNQSDAEYIDLVNVKLGAKSHIRHIDENVFMNNIIDAVWHFDGALSHTPSIGMLEISRCANENNIEVLLSGEGADELFGGYKYFSQLANNAARLSADEIDQAIVFRDGMESTEFLKSIYPEIKPQKFYEERLNHVRRFTGSAFDRQSKYEMTTQLPELLRRQDNMSMAYSVENRVPFLDNDTAALAWSIPEEYLINPVNKEGKFILKEIAKGYFGHEFAYRKKVGFFIPGNKYLSSNMTFVRNVLASAKKRGIFNTDVLEDWSREKLAIYGGLNHFQSALFLKLFTLEIWCQLFVDRKTVEECKALWGLKSCM